MSDMADEGGGEGEMGDILDPSMMEGGGGGQVHASSFGTIVTRNEIRNLNTRLV